MVNDLSTKFLSDKDLLFVKEYANCMNIAKATRRVFGEDAVRSIGHDLLKRENIRIAVNNAIQAKIKRAEVTADSVLAGIIDTIERCKKDGDNKGALKGYELLGKHLKLFTDVQEVNHTFTKMQAVKVLADGKAEALTFDVGSKPKVIEAEVITREE